MATAIGATSSASAGNSRTFHGPAAIQAWLAEAFGTHTASNFRPEGEAATGAIGAHSETLEFFFTFDTAIGNGRGFVRLIPDPNSPDGAKIFTILTTMKELKNFPDPAGRKRVRDDLALPRDREPGSTKETPLATSGIATPKY